MSTNIFWSFFLLFLNLTILVQSSELSEPLGIVQREDVYDYLQRLNELIRQHRNREYEAYYIYNTNVTEENRQKTIALSVEASEFYKKIAKELKTLGYENHTDELVRRQVRKLSKIGHAALPEDEYKELLGAISSMQTNYAKVKVCSFSDPEKCDLALEPEIEERITKSRNPEELKYYWKVWYDNAGTPVRHHFKKYLELSKKSAELNGFSNYAESWFDAYEDPKFEEELDATYQQILPFYKQIHAYVRHKLLEKYGSDIVSEKGPLPMHLLGNLWGQSWENIADLLIPYPEKPFFDVSGEMVRQNYTPIQMFEMGDEFFLSLNMTKLPRAFWEKSVLEKPKDGRDIICHASAWDLFSVDDVRIKQCTLVNQHHFYVCHHELGHIQYYLQYQHQPATLRRAPNPGFHEAVGDVLSLSVSTPKHLQRIGLLKDYHLDAETRINLLFQKVLSKTVFLPFAYTLDKYRWALFRGEINESNWNCEFWKKRSDFSGIEPPLVRSEQDFDPPAKYHVSADVEYLRYFVSHILQFQFLKAACIKAGEYAYDNPELLLDNCDIYQSTEAGNAFKGMLELGGSKHWRDALEVFIGERQLSALALLEYFAPLQKWLESENERTGAYVGWDSTDNCVTEIPADAA